jgi:predicted peroxiredoxin
MEVLYISSSGSTDATRASIPWHLAVNGSIESNQTARLVLVGDAAETVRADVRDGVEGLGLPPLRDLVAKAVERAVLVHV